MFKHIISLILVLCILIGCTTTKLTMDNTQEKAVPNDIPVEVKSGLIENYEDLSFTQQDPMWVYTTNLSDFGRIHPKMISIEPVSTKGYPLIIEGESGIIFITDDWEENVESKELKDIIITLTDDKISFFMQNGSTFLIVKIANGKSVFDYLESLNDQDEELIRKYIQSIKSGKNTLSSKPDQDVTNKTEPVVKPKPSTTKKVNPKVSNNVNNRISIKSLKLINVDSDDSDIKITQFPEKNSSYKLILNDNKASVIEFNDSKLLGKIGAYSIDMIHLLNSDSRWSNTGIKVNSTGEKTDNFGIILISDKIFNKPFMLNIGSNVRKEVKEIEHLSENEKVRLVGLIYNFDLYGAANLIIPMKSYIFEDTEVLKQITKIELDLSPYILNQKGEITFETSNIGVIDYKVFYDEVHKSNVNWATVKDYGVFDASTHPNDEIEDKFKDLIESKRLPLDSKGGLGAGTPFLIFSGKPEKPQGNYERYLKMYFGQSSDELLDALEENPIFYELVEIDASLPKILTIAVRDYSTFKEVLENDEQFKKTLDKFYSQKLIGVIPSVLSYE